MKRSIPLLLICLLLCGCGNRALENRFTAFSQALAEKETLQFTAEVRSEYDDKSFSFTLAYQKDAEGQTIRVLEPERIAGIQAHLAPESSTLEFQGLILDTGPLDPYGLSPMNALPTLVDALCGGHLESVWEEDGIPAYHLIWDDHLSARVWFDPETMAPLRAELQSDDTVRIFCEIQDWR